MIGTSNMDKKKIFITGSAGFVGKNLYKLLRLDYSVFGVDKIQNEFVDRVIDIRDAGRLTDALDFFNPDVIVHLAALSNVELCETDQKQAFENNVLPTKELADWARGREAKVIFISSDYVYDGVRGNFTEENEENPIQYYGKTKLEAEKIVATLKNFVILRPTVIYGWDPDGMNFLMQLYKNQMNKKAMKVPSDQISNPTFVADLCRLMLKIIEVPDLNGKYNATGPESMSRYDFALIICEYMGWDKNLLIPVKTANLEQVAGRPLNNSTVSKKACELFGFHFNDLDYNLKSIKDDVNRRYSVLQ